MGGKIIINFEKDMIEIMKNDLNYYGFDLNEYPDKEIRYLFFNFYRRIILSRPRKIHISKEFACPPEYLEGLDLVKRKVEQGDNLFPHLSRGILDLKFDDDLLNDWKIHHLHLGTEIQENGFINKRKFILYLYIEDDHAYFINVLDHKHFNDQELVSIIHNNWPSLIEEFLYDGEASLNSKFSNEDIRRARKGHSTYFFEPVPGVVYFPMGMGNSTSGLSNEVVRYSDAHYFYTKEIQEVAINRIKGLINTNATLKSKYKLFVKFKYINDRPYAIVTNVPGIKVNLD